eukprot:m.39157 g.39157  ORF g.39157 m.39157 type:complete len:331 (+) comp12642_c0_seq2:64-1056(+)
MMSTDRNETERHPAWVSSVAGGTAGFCARAIVSPFDVVKIRLQLQVEPVASHVSSKYRGVWHCVQTIAKEEGLKAFWKGHTASQAMTISYCAVQFPMYEQLLPIVRQYTSSDSTCHAGQTPTFSLIVVTIRADVAQFSAGAGAGLTASLCTYPFDIARTRLAAQGTHTLDQSTAHSIASMWQAGGVRSLYRGFGITAAAIVPYGGLHFAVYSRVQRWLVHTRLSQRERKAVAGLASGVVGKAVLHPLDVLKKRLQVWEFVEARRPFGQHSGSQTLQGCFRSILAKEGVPGLYKGLVPALVKAAPGTMVTFLVYDAVSKGLSQATQPTNLE